jgi:ABC-2 type transport system permease protein
MPVVLAVALHDLRRRLRDRTALMIAFIAPVVLSSIMGLAFGEDETPPKINVAVADLEGTAASRAYVDDVLRTLSLGPAIGTVTVDSASRARELFASRRAVAIITLPPGFTAADGPRPTLESSDDRPFGESIGRAVHAGLLLRRTTERMLLSATAGGDRAFLATPATRVADERVIAQAKPLSYFAPSMGIVFLFMLVGVTANGLLAERTSGTLARLQAAPVSTGTIIAGKTASIAALMLLSILSLWGATTLAFGAEWGPAAAVVLLAVGVVGAVGSLGLFVTVAARTEGVAQVAAAGLGFVLALLGGNFFPPGSLPPFLETLSLATPNGWALEGFTTLSLDRGTLGDVIQPLVILGVITVVVGTAAVLRLRTTVGTA